MDRRTAHALAEGLLAPAEQLGQSRRIERMAHAKIRMRRVAREFVPWAHQLAVIAAVDAISQRGAQRRRNRALELDRQVGNAAARIELIRAPRSLRSGRPECRPRNCRNGRRAGVSGRQRQVGEYLADEEPRAGVAGDQVGVLADPAQPGIARQRLLEHRRTVDEHPIAVRAGDRGHCRRQLPQCAAHDLVIVAAERVA